MDYKSLIANGRSVRDFKDMPVETAKLLEVEKFILECKKLVADIAVESRFIEGEEAYKRLYGVAGYNGVAVKAPTYLVLLSENKDHYIENAGYVGERAVLKTRDLGLNSCWVTFNDQDAVKKALGIESDKEVVALIAMGYAANGGVKVETSVKTGDNYSKADIKVEGTGSSRIALEEMVFIDEWNNNATVEVLEERALLDAFSYARLAPSALNKQPWRFIVDGGKVVLAIDSENYSGSYINKIDAGIVMLYFGVILDVTMFDSKWGFDNLDKDYKIPSNYKVVGYCNI
ncbi:MULTISPECIES: nitroreductase family protein [Peptostreptococcus]|jgi:hypothetical protein|uniref:Nitroreductase family protein n=1 Tax=Peptostreptococcus anaerobius TaxID=1261 RepID=A0A135YQA5_9FIRM|nr:MULTISPECIES: nitroreductase family protein [Peptostreptococcus]KXI11595.1 nitroreductase family protein [Peptostreptococcus anaerobius]MDB8822130.1 nitroreductase family protein [Peptostreptococcus anaerobius]MDB8826767.1 nitroreductase family protein [Peptostreptococcus anaerobius]MDB8828631.1 nitroreductase family protein [Peptostreptococcus anaerobius]MDB8830435.1 nitroreductase family protein [Peptostreptococcus anaerobius]